MCCFEVGGHHQPSGIEGLARLEPNRACIGPLDRPPIPTNYRLLAEAEGADQVLVPGFAVAPEVLEQTPAISNHLEQTSPPVVILLVRIEMRLQAVDPLRQQRDLNFGAPGI